MPATAEALAALTGSESGPARGRAWAVLVERHGADVWRVISSRCRDPHQAEDAYQDFWSGLPRAALAFRSPGPGGERSARAWLLRVAYTTALDHRRRQRRHQAIAADTLRTPEHAMDDRDADAHLLTRVQAVIAELPESSRRPLLLHLVAGLTYEELAADLRCTVNHARVKVHRALKKVRGLLGTEGRELSDQRLAGLVLPPLLAMPLVPPMPPPLALGAGSLAGAGGGALAGKAAAGGIAVLLAGTVGVTALSWPSARPAAAAAPAPVAAPASVAASPVPVPPPRAEPVPPAPPLPLAPAAPRVLVLDDFERGEVGMGGNAAAGSVALSLAPIERAGQVQHALRLAWSADHGRWIDATYAEQKAFPQVTAMPSHVTMALAGAQVGRISDCSVRFTDAEGEIFQWRVALPPADSDGWYRVDIPLATTGAIEHWGGPAQANQRIDPPLTLRGYGFTLGEAGDGPGELLIDVVGLVSEPLP